jgi:hypothetical protein
MAAIGTLNGAVSMPTGHAADFQTFDVTETMPVVDITKCGDTGAYSRAKGTGTSTMIVTAGGYFNGSDVGFGDANVDGAAATFTLNSGDTIAGTFVVSQIRVGYNRTAGILPVSFQLQNNGNVTTTI